MLFNPEQWRYLHITEPQMYVLPLEIKKMPKEQGKNVPIQFLVLLPKPPYYHHTHSPQTIMLARYE